MSCICLNIFNKKKIIDIYIYNVITKKNLLNKKINNNIKIIGIMK